jgi:hypothetical protein
MLAIQMRDIDTTHPCRLTGFTCACSSILSVIVTFETREVGNVFSLTFTAFTASVISVWCVSVVNPEKTFETGR